MSFLKDLKPKKVEVFKQKEVVFKQKKESFKQTPSPKKDKPIDLNPKVKSLADIPNTNIMTIGSLLGVRLRATKPIMLKQLVKHINILLSGEEKNERHHR